jgi:hypothetical protein
LEGRKVEEWSDSFLRENSIEYSYSEEGPKDENGRMEDWKDE